MELFGFKTFEELLAWHCAPVMVGIKVANLFSMPIRDGAELGKILEDYNREFAARKLIFRQMCYCSRRVLVLVYNEEKLAQLLQDKGYRAYLIAAGYQERATVEEDLATLEKHLQESAGFPHEIGIFLGYPLEDVIGFVINKGSGCKFSGYWKVYGDVTRAQRLFATYERYRNFILKKISEGIPLYSVVAKI